jgi:ribA/ribD-fused uncharacterized protein
MMKKLERLKADGYEGVEPILFYGPQDPFGCFSNFSHHRITTLRNPWSGEFEKYLTGEHRFQAMKATNDEDHDYVNRAVGATMAKERGGPGGITLRDDWGSDHNTICWYVMLELVIAKTLEHTDVQDALADTVGHPIYEDSPLDDIWGWRHRSSYRGKNLLGRCWMQARDMLL